MKLNYLIIPLITLTVASLGGYFTSLSLDSWYPSLEKPTWTPSGETIGIIWTFLYLLVTGVVLFFFNRFKKDAHFRIVISLFLLNALLNATWSLLFFSFNLIFLSLLQMVLLILTVIFLIFLIWPKSKLLSLLLTPYLIWLLVAGSLNYFIWILN